MRKTAVGVLAAVLLGGLAVGSAQLPPEIMADRYLVEAEALIAKKRPEKALELMDKIVALQQEHNFTLPDVFHYKYAQMALSAGSLAAAIDAANKYLGTAGKDGEFYREALELLIQAEQPGPEMVEIPGGSFRMGCVSGQNCDDDEHPVHTVRVESFELSKYEVTFEQYDRFTAATDRKPADDEGWGRGRRPVIRVSWEDAVAYVRWLSGQTGEQYRLPSEAEWEYAARAGTETAYSWGNEIGRNRANCRVCGSQWDKEQTAPVGSFGPNGWGLHDMHGNVFEWVQDCWNGSYAGAPSDGSAWQSGDCSQRVLRGGSWLINPRVLRAAYRYWSSTGDRNNINGFRVARTITP